MSSHGSGAHAAPAATTTTATLNPTGLWTKAKDGLLYGALLGAIFGAFLGFTTGTFSLFWSYVITGAAWGAAFNSREGIFHIGKFIRAGLVFCFSLLAMTFLIIMVTGHAPAEGWEAFTLTSGPYQMISNNAPMATMAWFITVGMLIMISSHISMGRGRSAFKGIVVFFLGLGLFWWNQNFDPQSHLPVKDHERSWWRQKVNAAGQQADAEADKAIAQYKADGDLTALNSTLGTLNNKMKMAREPIGNAKLQNTEESGSTLARSSFRSFGSLDPDKHAYQLNVQDQFQTLDVSGAAGSHIIVDADPNSKTCVASQKNTPCAGPQGIYELVKNEPNESLKKLYFTGNAHYYALIGRWEGQSEWFEIGAHYDGVIPSGYENRKLQVTHNVPWNPEWVKYWTGGARINNITIVPK